MSKNFKLFLCVIILLITSRETFAQSPDKINYQAIARNTATGTELSNQEVYVVVKILAGDYNGDIAYQEDHQNIQTNLYGVFNLQIGNGTPISGSFSELNWESNSYWLEIDLDAGQGLKTLGTMEFVSVPYALHAKTATHIDDADADPTNELVKDFLFNSENRELTIVQEGENKIVGIGSVNDADSDPYNEIIEDWNFSEGVLTFREAGNNYSLDLNTLSTTDADSTHQLVQDFLFNTATRELTIVQEGDNKTVNIGSVNDADSDPTNELIEDGYPQLNNGQLDIREGGIMHSVDLKPLLSWNKDDEDIYILSKRVGIGTDSPGSQLTVRKTSGSSEILRVENDQSVAALSVADRKVGLAGETGANHVQLHGSVGYTTKVLNAGANYTVQPDDYYIACRLSSNNDVYITMPDPSTCKGRVIYVRRANTTESSNPKVYINWNGNEFNFSSGNTVLQDYLLGVSINRIAVISLGVDGWAAID